MKWQKVSWMFGHPPKNFLSCGLMKTSCAQLSGPQSSSWYSSLEIFFPSCYFKYKRWQVTSACRGKKVLWLGNISLRDWFHSVTSCYNKGVIKRKQTRTLEEYLLFGNVGWLFHSLKSPRRWTQRSLRQRENTPSAVIRSETVQVLSMRDPSQCTQSKDEAGER